MRMKCCRPKIKTESESHPVQPAQPAQPAQPENNTFTA